MSCEISKLNGTKYHLKDVCRIKDPKQYKLYIKHDTYPIDMYTTYDEETGGDILIMLFLREDTKELYELWKKHELN